MSQAPKILLRVKIAEYFIHSFTEVWHDKINRSLLLLYFITRMFSKDNWRFEYFQGNSCTSLQRLKCCKCINYRVKGYLQCNT